MMNRHTRRALAAGVAAPFVLIPAAPALVVPERPAIVRASQDEIAAFKAGVLPGIGALPGLVKGGATTSTWNPSDKSANVALSNGNLTAAWSVDVGRVRGTTSKSTGKFYFEATIGSNITATAGIGVATSGANINSSNTWGNSDTSGASFVYQSTGGSLNANSGTTHITISSGSISANMVISVAVETGTPHKIYWATNGTWLNSADPASATGSVNYNTSSAVFPMWGINTGDANVKATINVGGSAFSYTIPSGFSAWG